MKTKSLLGHAIASLLLCATTLSAQDNDAVSDSTAQSPPPCSGDEHRQFDFWLGEWSVTQANGNVAGENSIQSILGGCVLLEEWTGASGFVGKSFNMYDAAKEEWRQTWVDGAGNRLDLSGGLDGSDMVLAGERPGQDGATVQHEIRWTPQEDGTVRQHWRASNDGGDTWSDLFVGIYSRKGT